jgi:hypothetical protein
MFEFHNVKQTSSSCGIVLGELYETHDCSQTSCIIYTVSN